MGETNVRVWIYVRILFLEFSSFAALSTYYREWLGWGCRGRRRWPDHWSSKALRGLPGVWTSAIVGTDALPSPIASNQSRACARRGPGAGELGARSRGLAVALTVHLWPSLTNAACNPAARAWVAQSPRRALARPSGSAADWAPSLPAPPCHLPAPGAAARFHWSSSLPISPRLTSPKQPAGPARAGEAGSRGRGRGGGGEGAGQRWGLGEDWRSGGSGLRLWTPAQHPRCSRYGWLLHLVR